MRVLRFLVNWALFLTLPIYGGTVVLILALQETLIKKYAPFIEIFQGKRWFWGA